MGFWRLSYGAFSVVQHCGAVVISSRIWDKLWINGQHRALLFPYPGLISPGVTLCKCEQLLSYYNLSASSENFALIIATLSSTSRRILVLKKGIFLLGLQQWFHKTGKWKGHLVTLGSSCQWLNMYRRVRLSWLSRRDLIGDIWWK